MDLWPVIRILTLVIAKSLFLTDTRDTAYRPLMFAMTIYQLIIPPTTTNGVAKNRYEDVCRKIEAVDCEQSLIFFKVAGVGRTNKRFQCQTHHV